MPVLQIYERPVALDREAHQKIRISSDSKLLFAKSCQMAIIAASELNQAIKDFPVVFIKENNNFLPIAIFGLQNSQNLFVDESGQWTARYTPAFIRRYPFIPALNKEDDDKMTVCIDEAAECINQEEGEYLFIDGKNSEFLDNTILFLQEFKTQTDTTIGLVKQLADAGLLTEQKANFKLNDGQSFDLTGFYTVDTGKLSKLTPETTFNLFQSGSLHIAYLHLSSLDNLNRLIGLHTQHLAKTTKIDAIKSAVTHA